MCEVNMHNYIDLSKATNIAMGNGAFAFIRMKIISFNIARKSLDDVGGNFVVIAGLVFHLLVLVVTLVNVSRQKMF